MASKSVPKVAAESKLQGEPRKSAPDQLLYRSRKHQDQQENVRSRPITVPPAPRAMAGFLSAGMPSGILVTKTGPGQFTVELSEDVPYGVTEEAVAAR